MNPRSFVNQFRMRQMVSDIGKIAGDKGDIGGTAFGVVAVLCAAYGLIKRLAAKTAVYPDGFAEMLTQRFKHLLAELLQVVYFFRCDAVLDALLCCCIGAEHLFQCKVFC